MLTTAIITIVLLQCFLARISALHNFARCRTRTRTSLSGYGENVLTRSLTASTIAIGKSADVSGNQLDIIAQRISGAGASPVASNLDTSPSNPIPWSRIRNPRDTKAAVISEFWKDKCSNAEGILVASMTSSVADGSVSSAVLATGSERNDGQVELRAMMRQCASWTGTVMYESDIDVGGSTSLILYASKLDDLLSLCTCLDSESEQSTSTTESLVSDIDSKPLTGLRIAMVPDKTKRDLCFGTHTAVEQSVMFSVRCAAEVFTRLGAVCVEVKAAKVTQSDGSLARVIGVEELAGCHILLSPASRSAAISLVTSGQRRASSVALSSDIAAGLSTSETLVLPGGVSAVDDDGYGSGAEDAENEGMPLGIELSSLANVLSVSYPNADPLSEKASPVLKAGAAFERYTRWSSEVFPAGSKREAVKEDMDDAREAFGFYFVSSLLRYFGKRS